MSLLENRYPPLFERLFRALGLRGPIGSLVTYEAQTGINMLDLTRPEYAWLWREQRYVGTFAQAAVAAQNSVGIIVNSSTTRLVMIDRLRLTNRNAASVIYGLNTDTASAGVQTTRIMDQDTRSALSTVLGARPIAQLFNHAAAIALPATSPFVQLSTGVESDIIDPSCPVVLRPGTALWLQTSNVNVALDALIYWREREFSDTELS